MTSANQTGVPAAGALAPYRVLDLTCERGWLAGRMLADPEEVAGDDNDQGAEKAKEGRQKRFGH